MGRPKSELCHRVKGLSKTGRGHEAKAVWENSHQRHQRLPFSFRKNNDVKRLNPLLTWIVFMEEVKGRMVPASWMVLLSHDAM